MKINLYLFLFICFISLIILPLTILYFTKKKLKWRKILMIIFSCFYFIILLLGTICTIDNQYPSLLFYFDFSGKWFSIQFLFFNFSLSNILINIGMLIPIGFIIFSFTKNKTFQKTILTAILISISIEIYQWILPIKRDTEIGDFLMNTLSGIISAISCKLLKKLNLI